MADPMQQQAAQQMQQLSQAMGGKPSYLFGIIPLDWSAGGGLGMQSCSPFAKNIPAMGGGTGKAGGLGDKFLQACMSVGDDFKKVAAEAGVMYSGNVTNGAPTSGLGGVGLGGNDIGIG